MNNHADIRKLLPGYCGGELSKAERSLVDEHLTNCPQCRADLSDLETAVGLIRNTPEVEPPPWLTTRIMARLQEEAPVRRSWLQRFFFPLHIKLPMELMALLIVCISGYFLARDIEYEIKPAMREEVGTPAQSNSAPELTKKKSVPGAKPAKPAPAEQPIKPQPDSQPQAAKQATEPQAPPAAPAPILQAAPSYAPAPPPPATARHYEAPAGGTAMDSKDNVYKAEEYQYGRAAESVQTEQTMRSAKKAKKSLGIATNMTKLRIRLQLTDLSTARETVSQAVVHAGGTLLDAEQVDERSIKARLSASQLDELYKSLERLSKGFERPTGNGLVEVLVTW